MTLPPCARCGHAGEKHDKDGNCSRRLAICCTSNPETGQKIGDPVLCVCIEYKPEDTS